MDEQPKDHWKTFTEEIEVAGSQLVERITQLLKEGNVRKLRVKSERGDIYAEIPLNAGVGLGGIVVLAAPWLALLGSLAGLLARVKIEVVRIEPVEDADETKADKQPDEPDIDI
ncbi:DUF4342 domain-containing protein [Paradevosia shaoguanensis]|uniref:DUF4342 domain-containing protein n=1 Tax=Paradevosia shaoguanensis TaxID=1335043 RepID=A0AA41QIP4_9HYPH|nr:DUF4342 domain-containing protein [Paradevosia shaoguanensis]MCF1740846.1 DUF4342 domain-containing protein [Paradevosia shaoguanensis]MCI0125330.1 DUF4342 domain-containing protein [Paradevosia shaoguanensis]